MDAFKKGDKVRALRTVAGLIHEGRVYSVSSVHGSHVVIEGRYDNGDVPDHGITCHHFTLEDVAPVGETDPSGLAANVPGAKLDAGKIQAEQVLGLFPLALLGVAEVGTFGANKYTMGGWQHVLNGEARYGDAGMRHWLKRKAGEELDPDSKLAHLKHQAWNVLAELELHLRSKAA